MINNSSNINNIFPLRDNLNPKLKVIKNSTSIPMNLREISIVFSKKNIIKILNKFRVKYNDVLEDISLYGKEKPLSNSEEIERIVSKYSNTVQDFDNDVVAMFIKMCNEKSINKVISYYIKKANARGKRNSTIIGVQNINFKFNVDNFRELHSGITTDNMSFDRVGDITYLVVDNYVRVYWELYMLLVFYKICRITQTNESSFFNIFKRYIRLTLITGMKMFMMLELNCCYGELYEELKGFKPINPNYLFAEDIPDKQCICFYIKNSDFLTEAYKNEYSNAIHIPSEYNKPQKIDRHVDIEFCIKQGQNNTSAIIEATISGQNPLGRIYHGETNPKTVINFKNSYNYDLVTPNALMFLFRTILNCSRDEGKISYYTELYNFINKLFDCHKRNLIPKILSSVFPILYGSHDEKELEGLLDKYFKTTDKLLRAEYRKLYKELIIALKQKKTRTIDKLRKEMEKFAW